MKELHQEALWFPSDECESYPLLWKPKRPYLRTELSYDQHYCLLEYPVPRSLHVDPLVPLMDKEYV